jgi:subtilisin family serine protease
MVDRPDPISSKGGRVKRAPSSSGQAKRAVHTRQEGGNSTESYWPHVMTGVDKVHDKGITGKGVTIAVIDTGIDYDHPALGGCFGEGCLVAYGYDVSVPPTSASIRLAC